jgi:hypothetical protein
MSARDELIEIVSRDPESSGGDRTWATDLVDAHRAEVLREALAVARGEYLTDSAGTDEDNAYDGGVSDVIAAIGELDA